MLDYYKRLFQFDHWANGELSATLAMLSTPPEKAAQIMSHIFAANWLWLSRLGVNTDKLAVWPKIQIDDYQSHNDRILGAWNSYIDGLSPTDLELSVSYTNSKGREFLSMAGDILTHVSQHSAYHRGQINAILRSDGWEPPYVDYIHYVRSVR